MTLLMYVRRKGWPLESVTVELGHERVRADDLKEYEQSDRAFVDLIRRRIVLTGDLTDEQRERIAYIAKRCPLHRTLESKPVIEDRVEVVGPS